jgi:hypothetical protein
MRPDSKRESNHYAVVMEDGLTRKLIVRLAIAVIFGIIALAPHASASEPRPWLCRDKPTISDNQPMTYVAQNRGGSEWVMTFLRFDPDIGHDGFTVVSSQDVTGRVQGKLDAGQWYAVGLYREGSHWICAAPATESRQYVKGIVRDLCYGEDTGSCQVKLTVSDSSANR